MSFILLNFLSFFPSQIYYFNLKIWRFFPSKNYKHSPDHLHFLITFKSSNMPSESLILAATLMSPFLINAVSSTRLYKWTLHSRVLNMDFAELSPQSTFL